MSQQTVDLLMVELDEAWQALRKQTRGLTDAEFFWEPGFFLEPGPGCWTVHQDQVGHWIIDYASPDPEPPPFTTIAWRLVHLGACKVMYHEYAFGHGALAWDELDIPHTAADAVAWLEVGHARLRGALESLVDADLEELCGTNWGTSGLRGASFGRWPPMTCNMARRLAACAISIVVHGRIHTGYPNRHLKLFMPPKLIPR